MDNHLNHKGTGIPDTLDIFHHLGVINTNLHALSTQYEKMGFILTPVSTPKINIGPGQEPKELGVGNRHAIFRKNYLELLGIVDPDKWGRIPKEKLGPYNIDKALERYHGLHVMHFGTDHIESVKERFCQLEVPCSEIKNFERNVQTEEGERTMRARTIAFPPRMHPEGLVQVAQHDTPELIFQTRHMAHPNGAIDLTELILCCEQPQEYISKYKSLTGHRAIKMSEGYYELNLGASKLLVVTLAKLNDLLNGIVPPVLPFMAAITVVCRDLAVTQKYFETTGINFSRIDGRLVVNPADAGGCSVIFTADKNIAV